MSGPERLEDPGIHLRPAEELPRVPRRLPICGRCDGCGRLDDKEGLPWSQLQTQEALLVVALGIAKSVACPDCRGTGRAS